MLPSAVCVDDLIDWDVTWPHHLGVRTAAFDVQWMRGCSLTFLYSGKWA